MDIRARYALRLRSCSWRIAWFAPGLKLIRSPASSTTNRQPSIPYFDNTAETPHDSRRHTCEGAYYRTIIHILYYHYCHRIYVHRNYSSSVERSQYHSQACTGTRLSARPILSLLVQDSTTRLTRRRGPYTRSTTADSHLQRGSHSHTHAHNRAVRRLARFAGTARSL